MKKILIVSDLHVPNHDDDKVNLVGKVMNWWKPDIFVINGDYIDCDAVSSHLRDPKRTYNFQEELDMAIGGLRTLEKLSDRRIFIAGNHEDRWPRYLAQNSPADNRRVNAVPALLDLGKRWEYVAYRDFARIGKLYITHDLEKAGKYALFHALADAQHNVVIGHTHRLGAVYEGDAFGITHTAQSFGWLGDVDAINYKHRLRAKREWRPGFGVGYLDSRGYVHLQAVPILSNTCIVEGKLFTV